MKSDINKVLSNIKKNLEKKYTNSNTQANIAWQILEYITQKSRAELLTLKEFFIDPKGLEKINKILVDHIKKDKPLQYIFGSIPFLDLTIKAEQPILIPRPETEEWCANVIEQLSKLNNKNIKILDLCTGTGCIALALGYYLTNSTIYAIDINPQAIELAKENAKLNNITNVNFLVSDLYKSLDKNLNFDLIVSNPPYITEEEWLNLEPIVKNWEDIRALKANKLGLEIIEKIIEKAPNWLKKNNSIEKNIPNLVIEFGHLQANSVKSILENNNFINIKVKKDLAGKDRAVYANFNQKSL